MTIISPLPTGCDCNSPLIVGHDCNSILAGHECVEDPVGKS